MSDPHKWEFRPPPQAGLSGPMDLCPDKEDCRLADNCPYAHSIQELRQGPSTYTEPRRSCPVHWISTQTRKTAGWRTTVHMLTQYRSSGTGNELMPTHNPRRRSCPVHQISARARRTAGWRTTVRMLTQYRSSGRELVPTHKPRRSCPVHQISARTRRTAGWRTTVHMLTQYRSSGREPVSSHNPRGVVQSSGSLSDKEECRLVDNCPYAHSIQELRQGTSTCTQPWRSCLVLQTSARTRRTAGWRTTVRMLTQYRSLGKKPMPTHNPPKRSCPVHQTCARTRRAAGCRTTVLMLTQCRSSGRGAVLANSTAVSFGISNIIWSERIEKMRQFLVPLIIFLNCFRGNCSLCGVFFWKYGRFLLNLYYIQDHLGKRKFINHVNCNTKISDNIFLAGRKNFIPYCLLM